MHESAWPLSRQSGFRSFGILGYGIWNSAQGIRNSSSTDKESVIQYLRVNARIQDSLELPYVGRHAKSKRAGTAKR